MWQDVKYALRMMGRARGFTAIAVLSLALGIGANTAIFSLVDAVLLRKLAVSRPEQLVEFLHQYPNEPRLNGFSTQSVEYFREHSTSFAGWVCTGFDNLTRFGEEMVTAEKVAPDYFAALGLKPAMGRLPAAGEPDAVVMSWPRRWTLGQRVRIAGSGDAHDSFATVVGVMPAGFEGLQAMARRTAVWRVRMPSDRSGWGVMARLREGVTIQQARAEMALLFEWSRDDWARNSRDPVVRQVHYFVEPAEHGTSGVRDLYGKPLVALMSVVGLLLLIACINVASLLLARGAGRAKEMAVRVSLGAGRWRLMRQVLTESVLLSFAGMLAGSAMAYAGAGTLVRIVGSGRGHEQVTVDLRPDLPLLLFTAGITLLTGLLFGLAPAWRASSRAPVMQLRQAGRGSETRAGRLFGKSLVTAQVALSILLLSAAGLFLSHVANLRNHDLGFRRDHLLLVTLDPSRSGFARPQLMQGYRELLKRFEAIPGVRSASFSATTPVLGAGMSRFLTAEGFTERPEDQRYTGMNFVAPGYFATLGTPLLAGRDFTFEDEGRPPVAIISKGVAEHYFASRDPIGRHVTFERDQAPYEIVGVVGDSKYTELKGDPPRTMYLNVFQGSRMGSRFELRTSVRPGSASAEARRAVNEVLKNVPVSNVTTMEDQLDAAIVPERLVAVLSTGFGTLGALLAAVGLYGLLAYTVSRRTGEIGVRMALGATGADVIAMVVRDALGMVAAGLAAGIGLTWWARRFAAALLPEVAANGIAPLVIGAAAMVAIGLAAAYLPARRASRVEPVEALRWE